MSFTYKLFDAIVAGEKTVTRRPAADKRGRKFKPPAVGDVLPLQRGYAKASAWARVVDVTPQPRFMGYVTDMEAHREGCQHSADFMRVWNDIYGHAPVDVWRIEFELLPSVSSTESEGR